MSPLRIFGLYLLVRGIACAIIHVRWMKQRTHVKPDSLDAFVSFVIVLISFELLLVSSFIDAVKIWSKK